MNTPPIKASNHYPLHQYAGKPLSIAANRSGNALAPLVAGLVAALAIGALLSSSYLAWVGLTSSKVLGCDGGVFDCGHVLTSRWSEVFGIPVGVPAMMVYTSMLIAIAGTRHSNAMVQAWALRAVWLLSMTAAFAALWFITLQVTFIGRLCPYCLLVHGCGIVLAGLMIWKVPLDRVMSFKLTAGAALMVAAMIATQLLSPEPETFVIEESVAPTTTFNADETDVFEAPEILENTSDETGPAEFGSPESQSLLKRKLTEILVSLRAVHPVAMTSGVLMDPQEQIAQAATANQTERKLVPILGGSKTLDAKQWPLWGNSGADHVVVEMFDYTCSHCRNTHKAIREASVQLNGNFAVLALPVPLHRSCNDAATSSAPERAHACEIARIAIAVWLADRSKFTEFHNWLFEQERSAADTRVQAEKLIGAESLRQQLAKSTVSAYLLRNVELYKAAGSGTVPKIIMPTKTIVGEITSGSTIVEMVRQSGSLR